MYSYVQSGLRSWSLTLVKGISDTPACNPAVQCTLYSPMLAVMVPTQWSMPASRVNQIQCLRPLLRYPVLIVLITDGPSGLVQLSRSRIKDDKK